jgi:cytochrome c
VKNLPLKKIATALVFALLVAGLSTLLADLLYQPKKIVKRGFEVEIAAKGAVVEKKVEVVDIATLIKNANIDMGAKTAKKCAACHNLEKGAGNKIGPNLFAVVGRKRATFPGFSYSDAMKKKGGSWTYDELNEFLTSPKNYIPGTKMTFAGLKKEQDRANVIAYLEKLGKSK